MEGRYSKFIKLIHYGGDILLLCFSFTLGFFLKWKSLNGFEERLNIVVLLFMIIAWTFSIRNVKAFDVNRVTQIDRLIRFSFRGMVLNTFLVFTLLVALKAYELSRLMLLFSYSIFYILIVIWRVVFYKLLKWYRVKGFNYRRVAIVGAGPIGKEMKEFFISDSSYGYRFVGFYDDDPSSCIDGDYLGSLDEIEKGILNQELDEIYCALPDYAYKKVQTLMKICDQNTIRCKIIPDFRKFSRRRVSLEFYGNIPIIHQRMEPLQSLANRIKKRIFDVFFSSLVILLIFPWLLPIIGIFIKSSSKGPIFFIQDRTGVENKTFKCLKFRTMSVNKDSDNKQASKGDPRITKIGAFLRKTNLDEFPQFFNVLKGDMSIIGPRPHMLKHTEMYSKIIDKFMVRHLCKPGITGWAQVNGYRGETKEPKQMEKRVLYDIWYLERWSFFLDIRIVFLTVKNMMKGEDNAF